MAPPTLLFAQDERRLLDLGETAANVRFGSLADICSAKRHVRFTPKSGHVQCNSICPLSAKSGHLGSWVSVGLGQ